MIKIIMFLILGINIFATEATYYKLNSEEIKKIFLRTNKNIKSDEKIERVLKYSDINGEHYLIFTKVIYKKDGKVYNKILKVYNYLFLNGVYKLKWMINDFILKNKDEDHIEFFYDNLVIGDYNNDKLSDIIISYGTYGLNGIDDGRTNIFVFYKNKKYGIRHKNSISDYERVTTVDKNFYKLPKSLIKTTIKIMNNLEEEKGIIFPNDYYKKIEEKNRIIRE